MLAAGRQLELLALVGAWASLAFGCNPYDAARLKPKPSKHVDAGIRSDAGMSIPDASSEDDAGDDECTRATGEFASCAREHALTACAGGRCLLVQCTPPYVNCDHDAKNGCETTLDSLSNCGLCGSRCALPNGESACSDGKCVLRACNAGFDDCDKNPNNGCETALASTSNCGGCGTSCKPMPNAAPGCDDRGCSVGTCLGAFGNCDHVADNGCEQALDALAHCGACDTRCEPAHASGSCQGGQCAVTGCTGAFVDCNGLVSDGCEATLDSEAHCGSCANACELPTHALTVRCVRAQSASCVVDHTCPTDDKQCVADAKENGCEAGFGDCDGDGENGCEARLDSLSHCGRCGVACSQPNAISACEQGQCQFVGCKKGFADCAASGCSSLASDAAHCGACGTSCSGATPRCAGGKCTAENCAANRADCDGMSGNACETSLNDRDNCGQCGLSCGPYAHASAGCNNGSCTIGSCDSGFRDCDGVVDNGCEVDAHTLENCGVCGSVCALPFAQESCADGNCRLVDCDDGRADCNRDANSGAAGDGCEASLADPASCGRCGNDCRNRPHTQTGGCKAGNCEIVCQAGYGDCDGQIDNGCEGDLASGTSCGACGNDCSTLPNVQSASCNGSLCTELKCRPGFGDCDGVTANGCERPLDTLADCGSCNTACAPAHGRGDCASGSCQVTGCDTGYSDCNRSGADGCEASLNEPSSCGSCANVCNPGTTCDNGECACTDSSQCGGNPHVECCNQRCINTYSSCSLWPCPIPSTARSILSCGGCNVVCPLGAFFCCGEFGE